MDALYVIEPGSYLRRSGKRIKIMRNGRTVETIPAEGLGQLTLAGRVSLSGPVLDFLMDNGIDTVFLTPTGRFRARLLMDRSSHVELRQAQYARLGDPSFRLDLARRIVGGKLENHARLLVKASRNRECAPQVRAVAVQIRALARRLEHVMDLEEIRGIEGYASRLYFSVFGLLIRGGFTFVERNRRPPRDPVNAMLSFVYTMFTNSVLSAIQRTGLDPYLGALHEPAHGRPSLACDLVEEWRYLADRLVLRLINRRMARPGDFVHEPEPGRDDVVAVLMKPALLKALITSYHRLLDQKALYPPTGRQSRLRWIIHQQSRMLAKVLTGEREEYEPYRMRT